MGEKEDKKWRTDGENLHLLGSKNERDGAWLTRRGLRRKDWGVGKLHGPSKIRGEWWRQ